VTVIGTETGMIIEGTFMKASTGGLIEMDTKESIRTNIKESTKTNTKEGRNTIANHA